MPQPSTAQETTDPEDADPESSVGPMLPHPGSNGLEVYLTLQTDDTDPPAQGWVDTHLTEAAHLAGVTSGSLSVVLVDDDTMGELHQRHSNDPSTTDVLTFDLADREPPQPGEPVNWVEGEIVVCRDEAERQAAIRGHDVRTELLLYAVHGLMHLLGEDDHAEADFQRMHRREDELLTQMGLGPVFHRDADDGVGSKDSGAAGDSGRDEGSGGCA